ncbi:MAG TPA: A24 family peptidase [Polyangiaceae bacterium]|jgi:prepilin peptidase CpaA|nr:A24 family peptidase [Polyangiaceae bacterium]
MLAFLLAAVALSAVAGVVDYKTGTIPNWLTLGGIVLGVLGHIVYGWSVVDFRAGLLEGAFSVAGIVFCSLAPAVMFWKGGMGGGDLKLFAALGALLHPMLGIEIQMYALVIAAVVAQARLAYEGRLFRVLGGSLAMLFNPLRSPEKRSAAPAEAMVWFRLGPAIFAASLLVLGVHAFKAAPP